jgi:Sec-independent protein translocase protein TatA
MVLATEQGVDGLVALTIGMATYNDFNGVYFTLQSLRLYQDLRDTELLVVDNYGCQNTKQLVENWVHGARYVLATEVRGTAAPRDLVFREARGQAVLCCDSHVLFAPGAIRRLKEYYREHPDCPDLLQGPLVYDDLQTISTHFDPVWRAEMWGIWATDPRGQDPEGEPFEIPMQGLGAFSCRKSAWPGFNPMFRGFGGEEGYIHEKFRRAGGRCLCLPWLRWTHRFGRPAGIEYPLTVEEKLRNYLIGHAELGLDPTPVLSHFSELLPEDHVVAVAAEVLEGSPQAPEPTATTPPEVNAGAAGSGAAPATLTEGADQVLQSPLLQRLPSSLLALSLIVFGPERIGQMVRYVGRFTSGARNSVEGSEAEPTAIDHPQPLQSPPQRQEDLTATRPPTTTSPSDRRVPTAIGDRASRRAIVCFVEDDRHLIQQALALRHSWLYTRSPDTDLVVMGPADVLARLPDDLVRIEQQPAADDTVWRGYRYANTIACLNGAGAEWLDRYTHILRTDVDTFITPAWNDFHPTSFMVGNGAYSNDDEVRQRIRDIAVRYGLVHRGLTNVGSTWYGPTEAVRRAGAFAEMLTKHILTHYFSEHEGEWPGWYRGVALRYAGEIAVNHCAPDAQRSELLDASSTSRELLSRYAHIHCLHTDEKFSKHAFMGGQYTLEDAQDLDLQVVRDYCMALSFRSLGDLEALQAVEDKPRRDVVERPTTANQDGMPGDPKECQPVQPVHSIPIGRP